RAFHVTGVQTCALPIYGLPSAGGYSERTVALWIRPTTTNNKAIIFEFGGSDNGLGLRFNSDDLVAGIASGNVRNSITLANFVGRSEERRGGQEGGRGWS